MPARSDEERWVEEEDLTEGAPGEEDVREYERSDSFEDDESGFACAVEFVGEGVEDDNDDVF